MSKNVLIAGKEFPDGKDFAEKCIMKDRTAVLTCTEKETETTDGADLKIVQWNKSSPLSTRSLVLNCENFKGPIDEAILYFDEPLVASKFENAGTQNCAQIIDDYISGYEFLTYELIARNVKKIVFIYKTNFSLAETITSSQARSSRVSSPIISACGAAFNSFAESIAADLSVAKKAVPILVRGNFQNETMARDTELSGWLFEYLDEVDRMKNPPSPKQAISWIKPGAKAGGLLSFIK